jgi:hypothetical protein
MIGLKNEFRPQIRALQVSISAGLQAMTTTTFVDWRKYGG